MPLILGTNSIKDTGYSIDNSLRLDAASTAYMTKADANPVVNNKTATYSFWCKKAGLGTTQVVFIHVLDGSHESQFKFRDSDVFEWHGYDGDTASPHWVALYRTTQVFRDPSAWLHFVIALDSTSGTAGNRVKIYVNGNQITDFIGGSENIVPSQNANFMIDGGNNYNNIVGATNNPDNHFDGYLAEFFFIQGQQLAPTDFGEFDSDSGIWKPKDCKDDLTFGTKGFYLDFKDSSNLGNDANGGTDFSETNIAATDQSIDTCTNNFATFNPLDTFYNGGTFTEGNLKVVTADSIYGAVTSTIGISSGKWYAEFKATDAGRNFAMVGIKSTPAIGNGDGVGGNDGYAYYSYNGKKVHGGTEAAYGDTYDDGDIIGVAVDLDNNKIYFSKNGTFQNNGDPTTGSTGTGSAYDLDAPPNGFYFFSVSHEDNADGGTWEANFGSPPYAISSGNTDARGLGNFEYAVPSGYLALCTKNLATSGG